MIDRLDTRRTMKRFNESITQLIDHLENERATTPGLDIITSCLDLDGTVSDSWLSFLHVELTVPTPEYSGNVVPVVELKLGSDLRRLLYDEEGNSKTFLAFRAFTGVDRRVFKSKTVEYDKLEALINKELEDNGDVKWSFFHFIYKTLNHVKQLYPFEIISVDGNFVKLLVVDPKRVGYLEIDFHFNGEEESRLLKQFEEET